MDELNQAMHKLLFAQTVCAYCDQRCESNTHLTAHLMLRHPKTPNHTYVCRKCDAIAIDSDTYACGNCGSPYVTVTQIGEGQTATLCLLDGEADRIQCGVVISAEEADLRELRGDWTSPIERL